MHRLYQREINRKYDLYDTSDSEVATFISIDVEERKKPAAP